MPRTFRLTYDYLCPFARIANEAVVEAIRDGAEWDVEFHPFSLSQVHIDEGEPAVWNRPLGSAGTRGTRAHAWALAVAEHAPERFASFHLGLFSGRHDGGADIDDEAVLRDIATAVDLNADTIAAAVAGGVPLKQLEQAHLDAVNQWSVFGVPTFISGDTAVFVRLMERHQIGDVERVLDLLEWSNLNEYKHTRIPR